MAIATSLPNSPEPQSKILVALPVNAVPSFVIIIPFLFPLSKIYS
jgi:hypothetical protein